MGIDIYIYRILEIEQLDLQEGSSKSPDPTGQQSPWRLERVR